MMRTTLLATLILLTGVSVAAPAAAQPRYAEPPRQEEDGSAPLVRPPQQGSGPNRFAGCRDGDGGSYVASEQAWRRSHLSPFRVVVGGGMKVGSGDVLPGLVTAVDIGRGPTGVRLSADWLQVGAREGLSQYAGELTLDFGPIGSWHPTVGAGAGVANISGMSKDGESSVLVGVGILRLGIAYRLPLGTKDARVGFGLTGVLPAIRPKDSASIQPWLVPAANVSVGF